MKALRTIRKYGGLDNYILLTKSKNMDSTYGEYLRKIMVSKLNNPNWKIGYIPKSRTYKTRKRYAYINPKHK